MSSYCFIISCTFPTIFCWRQPIFFPSFLWNQNWLGFKKILEIKVLDKSIISKKRQKNFIRKNSNSNLLKNEKKHAQQREKKVEVEKSQQAMFFPNIFSFSVLNSSMFSIIFYKFWTCSNNLFLSVFLSLPILTLHFMLFVSSSLKTSFEVLFLNLYLDTLIVKKKVIIIIIKKYIYFQKIREIVNCNINRQVSKKMISKI